MPTPATNTAYPAAKDNLPAIIANDREDDTGLEHDVMHDKANAAINALQTAVGTTPSPATGTVLARLDAVEAGGGGPATTDALAEGTANLYFTDARAKAAAVANALVNGVTDVAPSQDAVYDAIAAGVAAAEAASVPASALGTSVATLVGGTVPASQLPGYVDDVLEYANAAAFPGTGETGKIYIAIDTELQYRWSGSLYVQLTSSPGTTDAVPEGTGNLYFTAARVLAVVLAGLSLTTNAAITATDTVLSALGKLQKQITDLIATVSGKADSSSLAGYQPLNGDLTTISGLPISSIANTFMQQQGGAWAKRTPVQVKVDLDLAGSNSGDETAASILTKLLTVDGAGSGLDADTLDGISSAGFVQIARTVNGHALSADVTVTKGDVGLGNVDNTSDASKPVSTAQAAADTAVQVAAAADATTKANAAQSAAQAYADNLVIGLYDIKGGNDCSANPNYPTALKGDAYVVTVAGKIGGASGTTVDVGDVYVALTDNAGGTEASVGSSWFHLEHNLVGAALTSATLAQFAATTSAQLASIMTDETGSAGGGVLVFNKSPALITPGLGTPSALVATNATGTAAGLTAGAATLLANTRNIDGQAFNGSADITVIAPGTHAATSKITPVDADELPLVDSAASNVLKKLTWANLKATLKSYLDTLYTAIGIVPNTAPSAGQILVGNAGGTAYAPMTVSGNATINSAGVVTISGITTTAINQRVLPLVVQPLVTRGAWGFQYPAGINTTGADNVGFVTTGTSTGSLSAVLPTNTNTYSRQPRRRYTSGVTAGVNAEIHDTTAYLYGSGGYYYSIRLGAADPAPVANARFFYGLRNATAAPANVNPSTFTDCIGFGADTGDANIQLMCNDSSGTCTKVDLGASWPANTISTDWYEMEIMGLVGGAAIKVLLRNVTTGLTYPADVTTNIPSSTTGLGRLVVRNNGTTALAVSLEFGAQILGYNLEG